MPASRRHVALAKLGLGLVSVPVLPVPPPRNPPAPTSSSMRSTARAATPAPTYTPTSSRSTTPTGAPIELLGKSIQYRERPRAARHGQPRTRYAASLARARLPDPAGAAGANGAACDSRRGRDAASTWPRGRGRSSCATRCPGHPSAISGTAGPTFTDGHRLRRPGRRLDEQLRGHRPRSRGQARRRPCPAAPGVDTDSNGPPTSARRTVTRELRLRHVATGRPATRRSPRSRATAGTSPNIYDTVTARAS